MNLSKFGFLKTLVEGSDIKGEIKSMGVNLIAPQGKLEQISGNVLLNLQNASFENMKVSFFKLPHIKISALNINTKAKNGKLQINEFAISGDIEGKIKGSINLEPNIAYSKLNLSINLKPSPAIINDFKAILDAMMNADSNGYYNFKLTGSILSPEVKKL